MKDGSATDDDRMDDEAETDAGSAVSVELIKRPTLPIVPTRKIKGHRRDATDVARLGRFFAGLAIKEKIAPSLHVKPLVAEMFLTDNCNLRCVSCACWRTKTRRELTSAEWVDVIDQLADLGFVKLNFTGGEPLLRRDAEGLFAHAIDAGIGDLHLNTNAILLDDERRGRVLDAGIRSFNISIDGPDTLTHDAIRGRDGAFATTREHLRRLITDRDRYDLAIRMNFTVLADNVDALPAMADLAEELDVALYLNLGTDTTFLFRDAEIADVVQVDRDRIDHALVEFEQRMLADTANRLPNYSDIAYLRDHFDELVQAEVPCAESQLKLLVHSRGEIGGCWGHDPTMNVRDRTIAEIIDHQDYRDEHERLFRKDCVGCGSNYSLNLRWRPSTHWRNRAFAQGKLRLTEPTDDPSNG